MGSSCFPKPSGACTINAATAIVIIKGIAESLVRKPNMINTEQKNSANTARVKLAVSPRPKGLKKLISSGPNKVKSLGYP